MAIFPLLYVPPVLRRAVMVFALSGLQSVAPMQVYGCTSHDSNTLQNDPVVKQALDDAFAASHEGKADQHEEGGWIYDCQGEGGSHIEIVKWPPGKYSSITEGPKLDDPDCQLVGEFHTHAGAPSDYPNNDGYVNEQPSNADLDNAGENGVPGFIKYGIDGIPESQGVVAYGPLEPSTPCRGESEGDAAWSAGEPHLRTLDGYAFEFQAAGEFVLVRARSGSLEIQTRQEPTPTRRVTTNTAVVARIDGAVVEVNEDDVVVNGRASPRGKFTSYRTPGGGEVRDDGGVIRYRWKDGSRMSFVGRAVTLRLADAQRGSVAGLLGNFDGTRGNDLVGANGKNLLADGRLTFDELYHSFADAWRVTDRTSMFTYAPGTSTATYTLRDVPVARYSAGRLDPAKRAAAEKQCRAAGVTDPVRLADCIYDVAATGDTAFAQEAAGVQAEVQQLRGTTAESPLVAAISGLRLDNATKLLDGGADPDTRDSGGRPLLQIATVAGRSDAVELLLEHGAHANLTDRTGSAALHVAAFWGFDDIARLLLAHGADRGLRDGSGRTPAEIATAQHHEQLARSLR